MTAYLWWVPCVILYYTIYAYFAYKNNTVGGHWFAYSFIYGALCPFWVIVSRVSKNILFDGIIYDNVMFLTYVLTMLYLGQAAHFAAHHWLGLGLVVLGSVMLRS